MWQTAGEPPPGNRWQIVCNAAASFLHSSLAGKFASGACAMKLHNAAKNLTMRFSP
jgi:hypothetical protein